MPATPEPGLTPTEVVLAQLAGLRGEAVDGDGAGPGLRQVWAFASPGNREATGPVERFATMLRGPLYGGLLGHRAAQVGPPVDGHDEVRVEVLVLTADDRALGYTWVLSRGPEGADAGCWLTDAVLRHPDEGQR